jgi:hypothetical protein
VKQRNLKKVIKKYFKTHKKQRLLLTFGVLLVIALTVTLMIEVILSFQIQLSNVGTTIKIDNVTYYPPPIVINTNGPTYFNSYAHIKAIVASNHGDIFKIANFSASLDNMTWTILPMAFNETDLENKESVDLGLVKLDSPQITVYLKTYIPPQEVTVYVPPNVPDPQKQIYDSNFALLIATTPVPSSLDTGKSIVTFFMIFSATFVVFNFFKSKKNTKG